MVEEIALALGVSAVIAEGDQIPDPSWDVMGSKPFRDAVLSFLTPDSLLLDFHGMEDKRKIDLCIGMGRSPTDLAEAVAAELREAGEGCNLRVEINNPFAARRPERLIAIAANAEAGALQLEIARRFRNRRTSPDQYQRILQFFIECLASRVTEP